MKTVLVVDDSSFMRKYIKQILIQNDYDVIGEATNGEEAIEQYMALKPNVVTMDIAMDKINGIEASKKILELDPNAKIVIVSSLSQKSIIIKLLESGVRDFVVKPIKEETLLKTLEYILK